MDDKTFDEQTALDWIRAVEGSTRTREQDVILQKWFGETRARKVLEIGCGQGISSSRITEDYLGIDPSPFLISRAQQLYASPRKKFLEGSAYSIPASDCTFDAAFSILVWHLLADINRAAQELSRSLKEDGKFLIITANPAGYALWKALYRMRRHIFSLH